MIKGIWLLNDGSIVQTVRENDGFSDLETGKFYPKEVFLQYIQGMQGHPITPEAYRRILEGERSRSFRDE